MQVGKSDINRLLYGNPDTFIAEGDSPPLWSLRNKSQLPAGGAAEASADRGPSVVAHSTKDSQPESADQLKLHTWQAEALRAWETSGCQGVVEAVTGSGKTRVGLAAVASALRAGSKVLVLVPTVELQRQWQSELHRFFPRAKIGGRGDGSKRGLRDADVLVSIVNSARGVDWGLPVGTHLLVGDECHRYGSPVNKDALNPAFLHRLGLSATTQRADDGSEQWLLPYFGGRVVFKLDYRRAITDAIIARFKVALVGVPFSQRERAAYDELDGVVKHALGWLINRAGVDEEPFGEFMRQVTELSKGDAGKARTMARRFLKAFNDRRTVLAAVEAKKIVLLDLVPSIQGAQGTIVFSETIRSTREAASLLKEAGISAEAVDSKMDRDERKAIFGRFKDGQCRAIVAPRILDEGIDVPAADLAIILAASKTERQMIQRMGRVLRKKEDERLARFAIVYVEGSSEDPAMGAHGTFLERVTSVAADVQTFPSDTDPRTLRSYLASTSAGGPKPPLNR